MDKKIFILILALSILIIISLRFLSVTITGLIPEIALSIANLTQGRFIYFSYPLRVYLNDSIDKEVNFSVIFKNTGNLNITEIIEIYVKNSTLHTIATYYDEYFPLAPLQTRNFSATWVTNKTGTYWVIANASYNSTFEAKITHENRTFDVLHGLDVRLYTYSAGAYYPYVCSGEYVAITNRLENIGIYNATGNLTTRVFNNKGIEIYNYTWTNLEILINETIYRTTTYTAQ